VATQPIGKQSPDRFRGGTAPAVKVSQRGRELFVIQAGQALLEQARIAAQDIHHQMVSDRVGAQGEGFAWVSVEAFGEGAAEVLAPFTGAGEFGDRAQRLPGLLGCWGQEGQAGRGPAQHPR
jgi:hypothetical protein